METVTTDAPALPPAVVKDLHAGYILRSTTLDFQRMKELQPSIYSVRCEMDFGTVEEVIDIDLLDKEYVIKDCFDSFEQAIELFGIEEANLFLVERAFEPFKELASTSIMF